MKSFLFSFGNSDTGTIGCCIRIRAEDETEALAAVQEVLPEWGTGYSLDLSDDRVEYADVYFHPELLSITSDLLETETEDVDEEDED